MAEEKNRQEKFGLLDEPVERVIRHGSFWYHVPEDVVNGDGTTSERLVEHTAFYGQKVAVHRRADIERGEKHGAFYGEDELRSLRLPGIAAPADEEEPPAGDVNLHDLDDEELGDWLTGTGVFDGQSAATVDQVKEEVGDDQELAVRVRAAEEKSQNRTTLIDHLDKVANS